MTHSDSILTLNAERPSWPGAIAFVPTMGALHVGHLSLIRLAREKVGPTGTVVVSIFVNPLQFDRKGDLTNYPRTLDEDLRLCEQEGVDYVFRPSTAEFYQPDHSIQVREESLAQTLCGASRPGHFDGVCTVVLKLFNHVQPDYAVFGKKDYQQLAIIRRLVRDLAIPVTILAGETYREEDGLALSSRNRNLTAEQRADAPRLRRALLAAQSLAITGERLPEHYLSSAQQQLQNSPNCFQLDYLELVDRTTLKPLSQVTKPALLAIAAFYDKVRLIDNIEIDPA